MESLAESGIFASLTDEICTAGRRDSCVLGNVPSVNYYVVPKKRWTLNGGHSQRRVEGPERCCERTAVHGFAEVAYPMKRGTAPPLIGLVLQWRRQGANDRTKVEGTSYSV
uniref:Uncharacterized protein n=1 Tax=Trichuris muris TaxID=70415 RepID=A0A5S6QDA1_TRIMR